MVAALAIRLRVSWVPGSARMPSISALASSMPSSCPRAAVKACLRRADTVAHERGAWVRVDNPAAIDDPPAPTIETKQGQPERSAARCESLSAAGLLSMPLP
jgi:hypothetical protein